MKTHLYSLIFLASFMFTAAAQDKQMTPLLSDSFAISAERSAGASLKNSPRTTVGDKEWKGSEGLIFEKEGGVTAGQKGHFLAIVSIPTYDADSILRIEADIKSEGCRFAGLALLPSSDPGEFWSKLCLWAFITPSGNVGVYSDGMSNSLFNGTKNLYTFKAQDFNHLQLDYDPSAQTVTLTINDATVLNAKAVRSMQRAITHVCFRFEEASEHGPIIKNIAVGTVSR